MRIELLRVFLRVGVNLNVDVYLNTLNDTAPRDSLLFTCCSNSFICCLQRLGARREARLLRRVEAVCDC